MVGKAIAGKLVSLGHEVRMGSRTADFGWAAERIVDLGDLTAARGTEAYLLLWLRLWGAFQTG